VHGLQAAERTPWIEIFRISYDVGVDGLNVLPAILIAVLFPVLIVAEWKNEKGIKGVHGLLLLLQTALFGVVYSQDLFLLFFFWTLSAVPVYFLAAIWGDEEREKAAFRYFFTATVGNALFFLSLVMIYFSMDPHTFSLRELADGKLEEKTTWIIEGTLSLSQLAFLMMSFGLALRIPLWPIHGWFTYLARQTTCSLSVAITGVMVPVGVYIFTRMGYAVFPGALFEYAFYIFLLGGANVLIGAVSTIRQKELRLFLAYLCISESGLLLTGISSIDSAGLTGSVFQGLVMGFGMAAFGLYCGLIQARTGKTGYVKEGGESVFGGLVQITPLMALLFGLSVASLLGLPGLGGFVGHALIVMGGFASNSHAVLVVVVSFLVLTYALFDVYRHLFLGAPQAVVSTGGFSDLSMREKGFLLPITAVLLFLGVFPKPVLDLIRPTVMALLAVVK